MIGSLDYSIGKPVDFPPVTNEIFHLTPLQVHQQKSHVWHAQFAATIQLAPVSYGFVETSKWGLRPVSKAMCL